MRRLAKPLAFCLALIVVTAWSRKAGAYPWMIRHDYMGCATCHADPSGGWLLTSYGRAQSDLLLRMRYGAGEAEEPDKTSGLLWGLTEAPEWLLASGVFRGLALATKPDGAPTTTNLILMQADLVAGLRLGDFRAGVAVGGVTSEGSAAALAGNIVSREHWVGYAFQDEAVLLRAGRLNVPFGLRSVEHTFFVRASTRTDLNDTQQHGVALAYTGESFRGELMGILGNYQVHPDAFRERGYAGYLEWNPVTGGAFGVSSLITHAADDFYLRVASTRHAHGIFARAAPWTPLVIMGEADLEIQSLAGGSNFLGHASLVQADVEPYQGLHFIGAVETFDSGGPGASLSYAEWLGLNWFFAPHADLRVDVMRRHLGGPVNADVSAYMAQMHVFL